MKKTLLLLAGLVTLTTASCEFHIPSPVTTSSAVAVPPALPAVTMASMPKTKEEVSVFTVNELSQFQNFLRLESQQFESLQSQYQSDSQTLQSEYNNSRFPEQYQETQLQSDYQNFQNVQLQFQSYQQNEYEDLVKNYQELSELSNRVQFENFTEIKSVLPYMVKILNYQSTLEASSETALSTLQNSVDSSYESFQSNYQKYQREQNYGY